jgi:hypothetical protein
MLLLCLLAILFLSKLSQSIPYGSGSSSPSTPEWRTFLNPSPEQPQETHSEEVHNVHQSLPPPSRSQKVLSQDLHAVNARKYRANLKGNNLEEYKKRRKAQNKKDYEIRMKKIKSDPKANEDYLAIQRERSKKYSYKTQAERIQNPIEKEEYLKKIKDKSNTKARIRYHFNKLFTGQGSNKRLQHNLRKERIQAGTATQEDHEQVEKEMERRRNWSRKSKALKRTQAKDKSSRL